jgi:hypothetical protein
MAQIRLRVLTLSGSITILRVIGFLYPLRIFWSKNLTTLLLDIPSIFDASPVVRPCLFFGFICITPLRFLYGLTYTVPLFLTPQPVVLLLLYLSCSTAGQPLPWLRSRISPHLSLLFASPQERCVMPHFLLTSPAKIGIMIVLFHIGTS